MADDCLFCRIAAGEIPSRPVHEDDEVFFFHDLNPQAPVHVLGVPRRHVASLAAAGDADVSMLGRLLQASAAVARDLGVAERGYRVVTNVGADAGQSVAHLHVHLLAGRRLGWPPG